MKIRESMEKQIQQLHEKFQYEGILDKDVQLEIGTKINSSFAPEGFGEIENPCIFIDLLEETRGETLIDVYLHEVGHALHFFNEPDDWEEKIEVYEVFYKWGVKLYGESSDKMWRYYQQIPLEKEANEIAAKLKEVIAKWIV